MQNKAKTYDVWMSLPLAVLAATFVFDLAYLATGNPRFVSISFFMIAIGVIGFLAAFASREVAVHEEQEPTSGPIHIPIRRV